MSKLIAIRIPDDLSDRVDSRCVVRKQSRTDVLIEAIERGWTIDDPVVINRPDGSATYCVQSEVHPSDAKYAEISSIPRPTIDDLRSICAGKIPGDPSKLSPEWGWLGKAAGSIPRVDIEQEEIEDVTPECCECGHKLTGKTIKGRGIVWACNDVGCPMHGKEQR
jgi:hypothetical protein